VTKLLRPLSLLLWCGLILAILLTSLGERRVDFWWQLADGQRILATHLLPTEAATCFGLPRQPFLDEYAFYECTLALLDRIGGLGAIHAAFAATYLLIFALPLAAARGIRRDLLSLVLLALAGVFLINRYEQRPEIVGVLLLALLLYVLHRSRDFSLKLPAIIALIFVSWTNIHSSYLIGLLALGLWLGERAFLGSRGSRWKIGHTAITLAAACLGLLANPYGWQRIVFTFTQENDPGSNLLSREMWPAWDQPPGVQALMFVTTAVLVIACARRPRPAPWLILLAAALFVLTLLHIRHMSFLAVALLYLTADRNVAEPAPGWNALRVALFAPACIVLLLFDFDAARAAWGDLRASEDETNRAFVPALVDGLISGPVLCHDVEGSFLEGTRPDLFPLIDSGQMRFGDDTKRFYFFAVQTPRGFAAALGRLPRVDAVLVTLPVNGWALALAHRPGWRLAAWGDDGLLFRRDSLAAASDRALLPTDRLAACRDYARRGGDPVRAFCFSVQIDSAAASLGVLDQSPAQAWSEAFFAFTRAWLQTQPTADLAAFLAAHPHPANPLLRELLLARLPTTETLPAPGPSTLEVLARVLTLIDRGDQPTARKLFASMRRPLVSPLYYTLRDQLDSAAAGRATADERWQDGNDGETTLVAPFPAQLSARALHLAKINTGP
jgi:hypothetical protein